MFTDGKPSAFCKSNACSYCSDIFADLCTDHSYVKDIQQKICENAAAEYTWYARYILYNTSNADHP